MTQFPESSNNDVRNLQGNRVLSGFRLSTRWLCALLVVAVSFAFYVHFVLAFGVNVPFWDDWELLDQIREIYSGQLDWWKLLISKHNEHLVGIAFLVESWQLMLTGFDYKLQLVTDVLIQALTFAVLSGALWQYIPEARRTNWLCLSSLIWFSLCQSKDLLWPFQTAWFLVSLFLAITLVGLSRATEIEQRQAGGTGVSFTIAVAAAVLASFTSFQGIIVWFAGAVYLLAFRSFKIDALFKSSLLRKWLISASLSLVFIACVWLKTGGGFSHGGGRFSLRTVFDIFVGIHGDFWGNLGLTRLIFVGLGMLGFVAFALVRIWFSRQRACYALPVSHDAFGLAFVLMVAIGRATFGIDPASDSHYTAYSVLTYFGVLSILMQRDETLSEVFPARLGLFLFSSIILLATVSSYYNGVLHGIEWRSEQGMNAALLLKYREEPDFVLALTLFGDPAMVRRNAEFLEIHKFGAFGDPKAVPDSVSSYAIMPSSMTALTNRHPERQEAIHRAWQVYQVGSDLRNSFNPLSDHFAYDLINWCAGSSQTSSSHYLSPYLVPFGADYSALRKDELMIKGVR